MLEEPYREILPEWLAALAAARRRVPDASLPTLLELWRAKPDWHRLILPALGARGRWLAAQNPAWEFAAPVTNEEVMWLTGGREERTSVLQRLRRERPDRARELLASTWREEMPDDRFSFLGHFGAGLSLADEPFLETALDDSRKNVRGAAARLLARIPESRLVRRMVERVEPLLSFVPSREAGLLSLSRRQPARIDVTLPKVCDEAMLRDGVEQKSATQKIGERAFWLRQLLNAIPPSYWNVRWEASPTVLVEAASQSEWGEVLLESWTNATRTHRDAAWAEAIFAIDAKRQRLFKLLPAEQRETVVLDLLRTGSGLIPPDYAVLTLLHDCRHPWSPELVQAVLDLARGLKPGSDPHKAWLLRTLLRQAALRIPVDLIADTETGWATDTSDVEGWKPQIDTFIDLLRFRAEMYKEIAE